MTRRLMTRRLMARRLVARRFVARGFMTRRFVARGLVPLRLAALLLVAGLIAFPLGAHLLLVAQAFIFPFFPCQTFALHPQAFALRRHTFTFQHLVPFMIVTIPLGLSIRRIVIVIAILIIRGRRIRFRRMVTSAAR
jgi:hypothetical protein